jgi:hypothetical protein
MVSDAGIAQCGPPERQIDLEQPVTLLVGSEDDAEPRGASLRLTLIAIAGVEHRAKFYA